MRTLRQQLAEAERSLQARLTCAVVLRAVGALFAAACAVRCASSGVEAKRGLQVG